MIRLVTLMAIVTAADIAALDIDLHTSRATTQFQAQSLLTQIETRLATTARQLDVESAARQIRVHSDTTQLLRELSATGQKDSPATSLIPRHRSGNAQKLRADIGRIEYRETIRMQRNAFSNSFPDR